MDSHTTSPDAQDEERAGRSELTWQATLWVTCANRVLANAEATLQALPTRPMTLPACQDARWTDALRTHLEGLFPGRVGVVRTRCSGPSSLLVAASLTGPSATVPSSSIRHLAWQSWQRRIDARLGRLALRPHEPTRVGLRIENYTPGRILIGLGDEPATPDSYAAQLEPGVTFDLDAVRAAVSAFCWCGEGSVVVGTTLAATLQWVDSAQLVAEFWRPEAVQTIEAAELAAGLDGAR